MRGSLYIYMCTMIGTFIFLENLKKCLDKMIKWTPFAAMPEQFAGIREIIKEKNKVTRPILAAEEKELIENMLLCSLISEKEILITYYEDGYLLSGYMTVVDIDPLNSAVICTDVFYKKMTLQFLNIIEVK